MDNVPSRCCYRMEPKLHDRPQNPVSHSLETRNFIRTAQALCVVDHCCGSSVRTSARWCVRACAKLRTRNSVNTHKQVIRFRNENSKTVTLLIHAGWRSELVRSLLYHEIPVRRGEKPILVPLLGYERINRQANPKLALH